MPEPAVAEIRATDAERRRLQAVRSLVGDPAARVKVSVGSVLEDGDAVVLANEEAEVISTSDWRISSAVAPDVRSRGEAQECARDGR
jgi:hypothetical protein